MLKELFTKKKAVELNKDEIAELLKVNPEFLQKFEEAYKAAPIKDSDNLFDLNAKEVSDTCVDDIPAELNDIIGRIVDSLVNKTVALTYNNGSFGAKRDLIGNVKDVTFDEIKTLREDIRPQLTDKLMRVDVDTNSSAILLMEYQEYLKHDDKEKYWYHLFRQGLDILDLDPILYEMLSMNKNNMGFWLPKISKAVKESNFFKIPNTTIIKVPMPILQLTRTDFFSLTPTTKQIVNKYCQKVFGLNVNKKYFIKTGTYSSKFDFRNACITDPKEVLEIGEYLLFIQYQASQMASPLSNPCIYGVSTTNEWCVREFIEDKENNPTIYHGLPLHTEYRVFVDCDTDEVIGIHNYWDSKTMKDRFGNQSDKDEPDKIHDYIIYTSHEETLYRRYEENKDKVAAKIKEILSSIDLSGQWSIDVMQNGDDFWIIDMAVAENSAFYECVPKELRKKSEENWLPKIN